MAGSHPRPDARPIRPALAADLRSDTYQSPGKLLTTEYFFSVPLDHSQPEGERLKIFCRAVEKHEKSAIPEDDVRSRHLPLFVFITGGPGFGAPLPSDLPGLVDEIVHKRGYKLLMFDHRGFGLSTALTASTLALRGGAQEQADYLKHFRAPSAVQDLEAIRLLLTQDYPEQFKKWTILGQSYGGFVVLTYLSYYPEGLTEAFNTGGMVDVTQTRPDKLIRKLMMKTIERNNAYYSKFPVDRARVQEIVEYLKKNDVTLPSGGRLSSGRFLELGMDFGFHGGFDAVHDKILRAVNDLSLFGYLSRPTLTHIGGIGAFDNQCAYAVLHEPIYAQGDSTGWAFDRIGADFPEFGIASQRQTPSDTCFTFTGEAVFKRAFDDYDELRHLKQVAEILHDDDSWPKLYDLEQLKENDVPLYAALYIDDMYVDFDSAQVTAKLVRGCKTSISNALYHNAIRAKPKEIFDALFALRDDSID